ncbi:MAG: pitrilysin family protein [Spirochaetia bacterium]
MFTHVFVGPRARKAMRATFLLVAALALLFSCTSVPQGQAGGQSPDVLRATLDSGLRVIIVRNPLAPVVTQELTFFAGANQSPPGFPGMAHAQEHMMFRGSPGLSGDQLADISAQLGGDSNAFTESTTTSYYMTVPVEDLDLTLRVDAIRIAGVDNDPALWEKERGAIEQEVSRDLSSPFYVLSSRAREKIFAGTPYADTGLGSKETFDKTTAKMLTAFHDSWYAPNNALLVLAGDVDPPSVLAKVKNLFGPIPRRAVPQKPAVTLQPVVPETFTSTTDEAYGIVAYIFRTPGYGSPDSAAARILSRALNSSRGPITALVYDGKALDAGFQLQTFADTGYGMAYAAFPQGADEKVLAQQLKDALLESKEGIPADLVAAEQRRVVLGSELRGTSVSGLAQAWTTAVAVKGLDSPEQDSAMLQKVDAKSVNGLAANLLDFDHAITLVLSASPSAAGRPGGESFGTPESFASTPEKPVQLPAWAADALEKLPHPKPLFTPTDYHLPNGLRLIVQPLASTGAVSLFGSVHTEENLQAPQGQEGVSDMLDTLFAWGPQGMSRAEFESEMDSIGADFTSGTHFSLDVMPDFFGRGVELLSKSLLSPSLPADAFASQKQIQVRQAVGNEKSPPYQFNIAIQKALVPEGDPSLRRPTPASIGALTLDAVRAYHAAVMRPDETTIVVMGRVDPPAVRAVIEKYFGAWKASGPRPTLDYTKVPDSKPGELFINDPVREQNEVVLAETLPLSYDDPVHYALNLGNEFLGGGSFASPLYRELRVKRGLVYSVDSSTSFGKTRSEFSVSFGASPEKVPDARRLAVQLVKDMADHPMTDRELHLAKGQSLRQIELSSQTASSIAQGWLNYSKEGLALDRLYEVARNYETVSSAQVQEAFQKYIDPDRLSAFVLGQPIGR